MKPQLPKFRTGRIPSFVFGLLLMPLGTLSAQFTFYQPAVSISSYITPPFPVPDNIAFFVLNDNNTLSVNSNPDYRNTADGLNYWERVAWFSDTGAHLNAQAKGLNSSLSDPEKRSITMRTLFLKNVSLSTTSVAFNFRGNTTNTTTSLTMDNATFFMENLRPSFDQGSTLLIHATNGDSTIKRIVGQFKPLSLLISVDAGASLDFNECRSADYPDNNQQLLFLSTNNHAEVNGTLSLTYSYLTVPTSISNADDGFAIRPGGRLSLVYSRTTLDTDKLTLQGTLQLTNNTVLTNKVAVMSNAVASIGSGAYWSVRDRLNFYGSNSITGIYNNGSYYNPQSLRADFVTLNDSNTSVTFKGTGLFQVTGLLGFNGGTIHVSESSSLELRSPDSRENTINYLLPWTNGALLIDNDAIFNITRNSDLSVMDGSPVTPAPSTSR
jgi:hypothetical protein